MDKALVYETRDFRFIPNEVILKFYFFEFESIVTCRNTSSDYVNLLLMSYESLSSCVITNEYLFEEHVIWRIIYDQIHPSLSTHWKNDDPTMSHFPSSILLQKMVIQVFVGIFIIVV